MKSVLKVGISIVMMFMLLGCSDEDDNRNINDLLILGRWIPYEAQEGRNNIYEWDHSCGDDYMDLGLLTLGSFNLHYDNCNRLNDASFTYELKNGFLYITETGVTEAYKLKVLKLTATELTTTDPENWQENYIKFRK